MKANLYWSNRLEELRNVSEEELLQLIGKEYNKALKDVLTILDEQYKYSSSAYKRGEETFIKNYSNKGYGKTIFGDNVNTNVEFLSNFRSIQLNEKARDSIVERIKKLGAFEEKAVNNGLYTVVDELNSNNISAEYLKMTSMEYFDYLMKGYPEGKYVHKSAQDKYMQWVYKQMDIFKEGGGNIENKFLEKHDYREMLEAYRKHTYDTNEVKLIEEYRKYYRNQLSKSYNPLEQQYAIEQIYQSVWATDGKQWSDRLWDDKSLLADRLTNQLSQIVIQGKSIDEAIKSTYQEPNTDWDAFRSMSLEDYEEYEAKLEAKAKEEFFKAYNKTARLVRTELTYIQNQAAGQRYEDMGFTRYEIISEKNEHTCKKCMAMNGKRFNLSDKEVGVNYPPFHPNCRCTIAPIIEDSNYNNETTKKAAVYGEQENTGTLPQSIKQINRNTGEVLGNYKSVREAERANNFPEDSLRNIIRSGTLPKDDSKRFDVTSPYGFDWVKGWESLTPLYDKNLDNYLTKMFQEQIEYEDLYRKRLARERARRYRIKKKNGGK